MNEPSRHTFRNEIETESLRFQLLVRKFELARELQTRVSLSASISETFFRLSDHISQYRTTHPEDEVYYYRAHVQLSSLAIKFAEVTKASPPRATTRISGRTENSISRLRLLASRLLPIQAYENCFEPCFEDLKLKHHRYLEKLNGRSKRLLAPVLLSRRSRLVDRRIATNLVLG